MRPVQLHLALLCALLPGCYHPAELPRSVAAIEFRTSGEPIDAPEPDGATLTLAKAVERSLQHDPQLQAALARVRVALSDAKQARLLPNPIVSVALRFPEDSGKPVIEAGLATELLAVLQQPRRVSAADHRLRAASAEALIVTLDTIASVQEHYAAAQAIDAQMEMLEERRGLVVRLRDLAKSKLDAGEGAQLDVLTLETERASIESEAIQKRAERIDERLQLARMLGVPSDKADWRLTQWEPPKRVDRGESEWLRLALEHRPEIQAQRWELAARGDDAALTHLAALDGAEIGVEAEREENWSVGPAISAPVPLFDWGSARRAKAEAERIEARHRLTQARRQVVEDVRRALATLHASQEALAKVRDELIPLQERRRALAESQHNNGFADITTVLLAEQDLKAARVELIELQQKVSVAHFRLERAVGGSSVATSTEQP